MPDVSNLTLSGARPGQGQTNEVGNFQMSLLGHFTPPATPCQRHCKNPRKWQSKIPHFCGGWFSGCLGHGASVFGRSSGPFWCFRRRRREVCGGADVFGQKFGVAAQAVA